MTTWIKDSNGNKCSVEYFGSKDAAQEALNSLEECKNCSDCSDCTRCTDCTRCYNCSGCYNCSRCYNCTRCTRCTRCYNCSDCSDCTRCTRCYNCSRCTRCSDCSDCSDCTRCYNCYNYSDCYNCYNCYNCSDCSDCSDCSGCYNCSDCSDCSDCSGCSGKKGTKMDVNRPEIPTIKNIHQTIYKAVSNKNSFDMSAVHGPNNNFCGTTHCRAGWVLNLCGEAGEKLEKFWGFDHAAWLIYKASDPNIDSRPDFYCGNKEALADMKRLSELEAVK